MPETSGIPTKSNTSSYTVDDGVVLPWSTGLRTQHPLSISCTQVMLAWEIDDHQWTLGTSRLFLKAGQLRALEELRDIGGQASQGVIKKIRRQSLGTFEC